MKEMEIVSQTRNQEFIRVGKVSWNKRTSMNNSFTIHERKALQGKTSKIFLSDTLKTTF